MTRALALPYRWVLAGCLSLCAIQHADGTDTVSAPGFLEPAASVTVWNMIEGVPVEIRVEEGARVEKGALLIKLDPVSEQRHVQRAKALVAIHESECDQARIQIQIAKLALQQAELELEALPASSEEIKQRLHTLKFEAAALRRASAEKELERSHGRSTVAEANLDDALNRLARTEILAPIDGVVTKLFLKPGDTGPRQPAPILEIAAGDYRITKVGLPVRVAQQLIRSRDSVRVHVQTLDARFDAEVLALSPTVDREAQEVTVTLRVQPGDTPVNELLVGTVVRAVFEF